MKRRGFFWFAGLCLVLCAIPSKTQFLMENKNGNRNNNVDFKSDRKSSEENRIYYKPMIDGKKTQCTKYCIKYMENVENYTGKRINIEWNIINDTIRTFTEEFYYGRVMNFMSKSSEIFSTDIISDNDPKCDFFFQLGCEAREKSNTNVFPLPDESLAHHESNLETMDLTEGYNEKEFIVDDVTEELRILAFGKLSKVTMEIPIESRAGNLSDARAAMSLSRTNNGMGLRIDARNPPSGGWRLKLEGMENSNYNFTVDATWFDETLNKSNFKVFQNITWQSKDEPKPQEKLSTSQRLADLKIDDSAARRIIRSHQQKIIVDESLLQQQSSNKQEMLEYSTSNESAKAKFHPKFPRGTDLEAELMEPRMNDSVISGRSADENPRKTGKIVENSELEELSRSVGEIQIGGKKTIVDISPNAQLIARPGFHDVVFTVTNNQPLEIKHDFKGRSTPFPIVGILPYEFLWIKSGETVQIAIRIQVPNTQDTTPGTVTLYVGANLEVAEKSTYIYVQGSSQVPSTDNDKPSIDYTFNDNCNGKLNRDRCARSLWSVQVTAKDTDSGLKTVTSLPKGLEPRTEFIAGTKNAVTFYYVSTCCYTTVDIKATDVEGNIYTRTIDVTDWDNLSQGEIAAIVVGALMILLLIILIILLIIYCVRKRKSHDLSYSQRYGSRTPASAERTNF